MSEPSRITRFFLIRNRLIGNFIERCLKIKKLAELKLFDLFELKPSDPQKAL